MLTLNLNAMSSKRRFTVESPNKILSIVERDLIQCPLFGVSVKRESTVDVFFRKKHHKVLNLDSVHREDN